MQLISICCPQQHGRESTGHYNCLGIIMSASVQTRHFQDSTAEHIYPKDTLNASTSNSNRYTTEVFSSLLYFVKTQTKQNV